MKNIRSQALLALLISTTWAFAEEKCCWIDVKTGKQVNAIPQQSLYVEDGHLQSAYHGNIGGDRDNVHNPKTGKEYAREPGGCWVDVKTGKHVDTMPQQSLFVEDGHLHSAYHGNIGGDRDNVHNPKTGKEYVRVPCPQPVAVAPAPPEKPKEQPNPLRKILQGVSVGVGGGQTIGHSGHKGDHHVTDSKRTSSTTKKTLPAGCKCHPCTCSPCRCH